MQGKRKWLILILILGSVVLAVTMSIFWLNARRHEVALPEDNPAPMKKQEWSEYIDREKQIEVAKERLLSDFANILQNSIQNGQVNRAKFYKECARRLKAEKSLTEEVQEVFMEALKLELNIREVK